MHTHVPEDNVHTWKLIADVLGVSQNTTLKSHIIKFNEILYIQTQRAEIVVIGEGDVTGLFLILLEQTTEKGSRGKLGTNQALRAICR